MKDPPGAAILVPIVTSKRLLLVLATAILAAAVSVSAASSAPPTIKRAVVVVVKGNGKVTSSPRGISCPGACRGYFAKDSRLHLTAHPAAGWRLASWNGWCASKKAACAFYLTTEHECSSQMCAVGAFGVHVMFVRR
jgi:hypothetical protein